MSVVIRVAYPQTIVGEIKRVASFISGKQEYNVWMGGEYVLLTPLSKHWAMDLYKMSFWGSLGEWLEV